MKKVGRGFDGWLLFLVMLKLKGGEVEGGYGG